MVLISVLFSYILHLYWSQYKNKDLNASLLMHLFYRSNKNIRIYRKYSGIYKKYQELIYTLYYSIELYCFITLYIITVIKSGKTKILPLQEG